MRFEGARAALALAAVRDQAEADCAACHPTVASEWEASLHRHAFDDEVFLAAFENEPRPSCRACHAPRGEASRGVDCETCHVRRGWVIGAFRRAGSPHAGPVDPSMASPDACAGCHEFDFPDDVDLGLPPSGVPMQSTATEWAASPAALEDRTCQDCHMGEGAHLDHRFAVRDDPAILRGAAQVSVRTTRTDAGVDVEVELRATRVGHGLPTGDLFRELRLELRGGDRVEERVYGHVFAPEPLSAEARARTGFDSLRRPVGDTRLYDGEVRVERFEAWPDVELSITLDHLLMPPALAATLGVSERRNRTRLFETRVSPGSE
ncbi:MAG: hypothetical protein H6719_18400 [Sandaracinaceae bacterium]|nr:hypothetical protein [Sandaracinaceae bacterium]